MSKIQKTKRKRESDDENNNDMNNEVQVNFDFFHPLPDDINGISGLLRKYLDNNEFHSMDLADLIIEEGKEGKGIGSVVSANEGEDVVGFISCIDLKIHEKNTGVVDIMNYIKNITKKHGSSSSSFILSSFSSSTPNDLHFGLLLCERLINIPPEITPHMYNSLFNEISAITNKKDKETNKEYLNINRFIIISRIVLMNEFSTGGKKKKKEGKENKNKRVKVDEEEKLSASSLSSATELLPLSLSDEGTIFLHPEDELFLRLSICAFTFPIVNDGFRMSISSSSSSSSSSSQSNSTSFSSSSSTSPSSSSSTSPSSSSPPFPSASLSSSSPPSPSPTSPSSSSPSSLMEQGLLIVLDQNALRLGVNELYTFFDVKKIE